MTEYRRNDDERIIQAVRGILTSLKADQSKLHLRVFSGRVHLGGELIQETQTPIHPLDLFDAINRGIHNISGVQNLYIEPDLEESIRKYKSEPKRP